MQISATEQLRAIHLVNTLPRWMTSRAFNREGYPVCVEWPIGSYNWKKNVDFSENLHFTYHNWVKYWTRVKKHTTNRVYSSRTINWFLLQNATMLSFEKPGVSSIPPCDVALWKNVLPRRGLKTDQRSWLRPNRERLCCILVDPYCRPKSWTHLRYSHRSSLSLSKVISEKLLGIFHDVRRPRETGT